MIYHLLLFELKNLKASAAHVLIVGSFILLSLFFASLSMLDVKGSIFFVLFLSLFLPGGFSVQDDIEDGTLCLIYHSPFLVDVYYLIKLLSSWLVHYFVSIVFVALGSFFFGAFSFITLKILALWLPVSLGLMSLQHALRLLGNHIGLQYVLVLPLSLPILLFYQGATHDSLWSLEAKVLYGLCFATVGLSGVVGSFLLRESMRHTR